MAFRIRKRLSDICVAHRLPGHEGKCKFLHGHNYFIYITLEADELNEMGFVVDFKDVKKFQEVVDVWDHSLLLWEKDPFSHFFPKSLYSLSDTSPHVIEFASILQKIFLVPFIPTVENMSQHLYEKAVGFFSKFEKVRVVSVEMYETSDASCEYTYTPIFEEGKE